MGQVRFEQLKRFCHISPQMENLPSPLWYQKLELLSSALQQRFQEYCIPATEVSIDEMMRYFIGGSVHTVRLPNKPIQEGYKVFALCEHGYTFSFMYNSRVEQFSGQDLDLPYLGLGFLPLSPISHAVVKLATALPSQQYRFTLYYDNYLSNLLLFQALRYLQIAARSTAQPNSGEYPRVLKMKKKQRTLTLGYCFGGYIWWLAGIGYYLTR